MSAEPAAHTGLLHTRLARPVGCAVATALGCLVLAVAGAGVTVLTGAAIPGPAGMLAAAAAIGVLAGYSVSGSV